MFVMKKLQTIYDWQKIAKEMSWRKLLTNLDDFPWYRGERKDGLYMNIANKEVYFYLSLEYHLQGSHEYIDAKDYYAGNKTAREIWKYITKEAKKQGKN